MWVLQRMSSAWLVLLAVALGLSIATGPALGSETSDSLRVLQAHGVNEFRSKASTTATGSSSNVVFDVGFNNGADTAFFLSQGYKVVGVDANPELIQKGHAMFQRAEQEGRLLLANMALALPPSQGNSQAARAEPYATFWINKQNDVASSFDAAKCNSQRQGGPPCVPMNLSSVRCVSLWAITTPFYLKVDIEEYHYVCLEALLHLPARFLPKYVSWELHEFQHLPYPLFDLKYIIKLYDLGYTKIKQVIQGDKARSQFVMPDQAQHGFEGSTEWVDVKEFIAEGVRNPRDHKQAWCDFYMKRDDHHEAV